MDTQPVFSRRDFGDSDSILYFLFSKVSETFEKDLFYTSEFSELSCLGIIYS